MTHSLFAAGTQSLWNGKRFETFKGENRFKVTDQDATTINYDHSFDYGLETSRIFPESQSVVLQYNKYQKISQGGWRSLLWKSMCDELRVIECTNGDFVLLGLGCMAWSGGMMNASPFCLFRADDTSLETSSD